MAVVVNNQRPAVTDWDAMEQIYAHTFTSALQVSSKEHPLVLADPCNNTRANREKQGKPITLTVCSPLLGQVFSGGGNTWLCIRFLSKFKYIFSFSCDAVQLLFEKFDTPALFLSSAAVLCAFSAGKTTALVVDMGAGITSTVPVFEGFKLQKGNFFSFLFFFLLDFLLLLLIILYLSSQLPNVRHTSNPVCGRISRFHVASHLVESDFTATAERGYVDSFDPIIGNLGSFQFIIGNLDSFQFIIGNLLLLFFFVHVRGGP